MKTRGISDEARLLHSALRERGIDARIEQFDGHKHIDIAIVPSRLNIEVDGDAHYTDTETMLRDLARDYFSGEKGYDTIHIPNHVITDQLSAVADTIAEVARLRMKGLPLN